MANNVPLAYADVELQLATAISVGSTSFTLTSATDDDGVALPAGKYCFTIDNGASNKEYLIGQLNGVDVTSVNSVSRQGVETTGAARAHRVGASVIISDFASIQRLVDIARGVGTLDGSSPVAYDTAPTLSSNAQLATVGYVLSVVTGGTVSFDNQVITGVNGGESIVAGNLVYLNTADQEWYRCDADTASTVENVQIGIARGTGSNGVAITNGVQIAGVYTTSGLTAGSTYYASNTVGAISTTAGTTPRVIGVALSTTRLLIIPRTPRDIKDSERDALVGTPSTPSSTNKFVTQAKSVTAGATINGATTPVPVYQNDSDFEFYACDANDTAATKFLGFAISNGTDGATMLVQFDGIVSGFTGLTRGEKYYVTDTAGTISTTAGTNEILVGFAISTTEILIMKSKRRATGTASFNTTTTSAVTVGFRPSSVRIQAFQGTGGTGGQPMSMGGWNASTGNGHVRLARDGSGNMTSGTSTTEAWNTTNSGSSNIGTVTTITDTGFTLSNTATSAPGSTHIFWEAEGEL